MENLLFFHSVFPAIYSFLHLQTPLIICDVIFFAEIVLMQYLNV